MLRDTAVEQTMRAFHGFFHVFITFGFSEMLESHVNISTDSPLSLHRRFWCNFKICTIDMRFKFDALFGNLYIWQTKNLKTTGIGESWFMPTTKLC